MKNITQDITTPPPDLPYEHIALVHDGKVAILKKVWQFGYVFAYLDGTQFGGYFRRKDTACFMARGVANTEIYAAESKEELDAWIKGVTS